MHILHIFNEINFSGAEIMYANAAPLFQKDGFKLTAVNTGNKMGNFVSEFEKANISIIHRPLSLGYKNPFSLLRYFRNMYAFIKKEKVDIVHIHRPDIFWYYAFCAFVAGKKTIMTPHNVFKNRKITWIKAYLERMSARKFLRTTFQTIGESVHNNELNYYKNPSTRINNWYDNKRFFPATADEKIRIRKDLKIAQGDFVIISAGSCLEGKNHKAILTALALVVKQCPCIYIHLGSGHLEAEEMKLAEELNIKDHVMFLGNRINVRDYLIAADVFIMPSRFEGLSIAGIEAMACGLPCILYNSPGLRDLIKNDDNGFLISHDPSLIAEKIMIFKNNPALMQEKGNNALKFVNTHFYMPTSVNSIEALYKNK